ncbi:MAG: glycosyltransferase family 2 protein [Acidimicrobiia bacterium]
MAVVVLMPAFNEGTKIADVLAAMPKSLLGRDLLVVVIDDGSTDGTADIAESSGASVIRQPSNQGKGAALAVGLDHVRSLGCEATVWMDSDGQHLPESLSRIVAPVLFDDIDLCVGSRYLDERQRHSAPLNRRLVRQMAIGAVQRITGYHVTDPFSGFRCLSRRALETVHLEGRGYESELESCFAVARAGLTYREVPIPRIYGPGTSKMGHRRGALIGRIAVVAGYRRTINQAEYATSRAEGALVRG